MNASKAVLNMLTRTSPAELAEDGVFMNNICATLPENIVSDNVAPTSQRHRIYRIREVCGTRRKISMLKVKGLTIRYSTSTALALACAADKLAFEAAKARNNRKVARYMDARTRFLMEGLGATSAIPIGTDDAQRAAIETLREDASARAEARAAIMKRFGDHGLPPWAWIVHGIGICSVIDPVDLSQTDDA